MNGGVLHSDPVKFLGLGATALSVGSSVFLFWVTSGMQNIILFPGSTSEASVSLGVLRLLLHGPPILAVIGLVVAWLGWRSLGGGFMAVGALGCVLDFFMVPFPVGMPVTIVGAAWMGVALVAFQRPARRIDGRAFYDAPAVKPSDGD